MKTKNTPKPAARSTKKISEATRVYGRAARQAAMQAELAAKAARHAERSASFIPAANVEKARANLAAMSAKQSGAASGTEQTAPVSFADKQAALYAKYMQSAQSAQAAKAEREPPVEPQIDNAALLASLKSQFDPEYESSSDQRYWRAQAALKQRINALEKQMNSPTNEALDIGSRAMYKYQISELSDKVKRLNDMYTKHKRLNDTSTLAKIKTALAKVAAQRNKLMTDYESENTLSEDDEAVTADQLNVGDPVTVTGDSKYAGKTGEIDSFGRDKSFVVVNLYNAGRHSFKSSDVIENLYAGSDGEESGMNDSDPQFRDWGHELDEALERTEFKPKPKAKPTEKSAKQVEKPGMVSSRAIDITPDLDPTEDEIIRTARAKYPNVRSDLGAVIKWVQRSQMHSKENTVALERKVRDLEKRLTAIETKPAPKAAPPATTGTM